MNDIQRCIENCEETAKACLRLIPHCLEKGGEHASSEYIGLLLDCSEACRASVAMMARGSMWHKAYCALCARVCEMCAEECEALADDAQMEDCAEACRLSAESCTEMAEHPDRPEFERRSGWRLSE